MEDRRSHGKNRHERSISSDLFSFPTAPPEQDSDFEFGCLTPDSPTTNPYKISPADHLFYNGKLLPHSFPPPQQQPPLSTSNISRSTSRTSSRKDSLMSSRSNSVNSSRSSVSCSSGRTSSSENSVFQRSRKYGSVSSSSPVASKLVMAQLYGSSQRWQHIVPLPALKREDSKRSRSNCNIGRAKNGTAEKCKKCDDEKKSGGIWLRLLKSMLVACRQCHAMEPSTTDTIKI